MKSTNKKSQAKEKGKNLIKSTKTYTKKAEKSESYDIHNKRNRKLSQIILNKKKKYSPQRPNLTNISNNNIFSKIRVSLSPKVKRKNAEDTKKDNGLNIKTKLESKNIKESPKKDKTTSNKENEIQNPKEESKLSITNTNISMNNGKKSDEKILIIKDDSKNFIREKSEIINEINKILNQEKLNEELLIENIKILLDDYPAINKFDKVKSELLSKDDFEIFDDKINNKKFLFKVNLNNIYNFSYKSIMGRIE